MNFGRKNKVHIESGMSTLSDIIFMLLIFFIIASASQVQNLKAMGIEPPKSSTSADKPAGIKVSISKELVYSLNGAAMDKMSLQSELNNQLINQEDKRVILVVDRNVPTGETVELFSIIKSMGGQPFIATEKAQ